jgi:uncharacterized membrane protein
LSPFVLPALLVAPYLLYAIRGGMPPRLPGYMIAVFLLLVGALLLLRGDAARRAFARRPRTFLAAGAIAFILVATPMGWVWNPRATAPEISNFHAEYLDTMHGGFFTHPTENRTEFAIHFSPVHFLSYAIFTVIPRPFTLFAVGTLMLTLAIPAAWRFLRPRWGDGPAALLAFGAVLYPSVISQPIDFSPVRFAPLAIWLVLIGYRERNIPLLVLATIYSWMVKETLSLPFFMLGAVALMERRSWRWVVIPSATAVIVFLITNQWIIPTFAGTVGKSTSTIVSQFGHWGATAPEVVKGFITDPGSTIKALFRLNNLAYLLKLGHPVLFILPFGSPIALMAIPELLVNTLAGYNPALIDPSRPGPWTAFLGHYSVTIGTILWAAACEAWAPKADAASDPEAEARHRWARAVILFLAVLSACIYPTNAESV